MKYHCETCIDNDCEGSPALCEALAEVQRLREELDDSADVIAARAGAAARRAARCPSCARTLDGLLGWTCCRCRTFNIEAKTECKGCGHIHRPAGTLASIPPDASNGNDR